MFYLDPNFRFHWIESAPSGNVHLIEKYLSKFNEIQANTEIKEQQKAIAIDSLLSGIAELAGVDKQLLLNDIEGVLNKIAAVNFSVKKAVDDTVNQDDKKSKKEKEKEEVVTLEDYHYQLVTSLVNCELAVDLESALKIAENTPYKQLEGFITARIKFLNHDSKDKEKISEEVVEEIVDNTFFEGAKEAFFNQIG